MSCASSPGDDAALALVAAHCTPCHAEGGRGGIVFDSVPALRRAPVADMLSSCEMPPAGLDAATRGALVSWARCR